VIVPDAGVLIPFSLKVNPVGDGDGYGLGLAAGLGEGEVVAVLPVEPQAVPIAATVTSAINLFNLDSPTQDRSRRYPCRLLEEA